MLVMAPQGFYLSGAWGRHACTQTSKHTWAAVNQYCHVSELRARLAAQRSVELVSEQSPEGGEETHTNGKF